MFSNDTVLYYIPHNYTKMQCLDAKLPTPSNIEYVVPQIENNFIKRVWTFGEYHKCKDLVISDSEYNSQAQDSCPIPSILKSF